MGINNTCVFKNLNLYYDIQELKTFLLNKIKKEMPVARKIVAVENKTIKRFTLVAFISKNNKLDILSALLLREYTAGCIYKTRKTCSIVPLSRLLGKNNRNLYSANIPTHQQNVTFKDQSI